MTWEILQGDAVEVLRTLPAKSAHMCCTSPPYWQMRNYSAGPAEIGQEDSVEAWLTALLKEGLWPH